MTKTLNAVDNNDDDNDNSLQPDVNNNNNNDDNYRHQTDFKWTVNEYHTTINKKISNHVLLKNVANEWISFTVGGFYPRVWAVYEMVQTL